MVACLCFNTLGAMVNHHHHHCVWLPFFVTMPCHPIHAIHTKPCQQVCNVWVWCQLSTHLTNLFVACIAWWVLCGGVLVHTGLDATPPVVHTMGCNALVCCHQCLCVVCALPSIVSTTTTTLLHHWCVCGWSTPGQRCCWAVCWLISLITLLHHTPFLLFVLQLVCCAVCGSACVATGVVCVGACCCTLPQSPSQALVNVAPGCPCVVMLHHTCVCQVVLFGHTWLTTMWWTLLMLVSLAVHMWWLFVTT